MFTTFLFFVIIYQILSLVLFCGKAALCEIDTLSGVHTEKCTEVKQSFIFEPYANMFLESARGKSNTGRSLAPLLYKVNCWIQLSFIIKTK